MDEVEKCHLAIITHCPMLKLMDVVLDVESCRARLLERQVKIISID